MDNRVRQVTVMLSQPKTLVSSGIKLYTRKPYAHVSLGMDLTLDEVYSFSRKKIYMPLSGRFMRENIHGGVYALYKSTECAIYTVDLTEKQYEELRDLVNEFIREQHKYKYNFLGIWGVLRNKVYSNPHRFFCSEFVAYSFEYIGVKIINKHPSLSSAGDFMVSPHMNLIYKGKLCEYDYNKIKKLDKVEVA